MKNFYDVQQLLKRFGIIIYVGERLADLELMEMEIQELYNSKLIQVEEYTTAMMIIRREKSQLK
ncbi:DUF910 family protein [Ornithinibacillus sp. L9]|uniref:DUF910 family protein n=1 Tax=Ornithinibacillus caprae TaxID=2678566 RepID=A0A6N8FEL2_9BACI|nr:YqgQ family protein [Ornithinibacillus caprae]MUK87126.1 DUF910 family protein [Ornithinibacillus caprae]